jgi:Protein of unknown function (DUF4089)
MARSRGPRPKPKAARRRPSPRRTRPSRLAAPALPLEDFVKAAVQALALPLKPEWLPTVAGNLDVNLRMAALVGEFPLPDESEPAPVFTA